MSTTVFTLIFRPEAYIRLPPPTLPVFPVLIPFSFYGLKGRQSPVKFDSFRALLCENLINLFLYLDMVI